MSLEDTTPESVDTAAPETPDVSDDAGASADVGDAGAESPPTAEPSEAAAADVVEDLVNWNGDLASLRETPGYADLPAGVRKGIEAKLQDIQSGWQRTYVGKLGEVRSRKADLDALENRIREDEKKVMRFLHGSGDPLDEARAEIEELKSNMKIREEAIRSEYEEAVNKIRTSSGEEMRKAVEARDEALAKLQAHENSQKALAEAEAEKRANELESFIQEKAPVLAENEEAFNDWIALLQKGRSAEDAYKRLRLYHDNIPELGAKAEEEVKEEKPEPKKPDTPPKSVKTMSMGGGAAGTKSGQVADLDSILRGMRQAASTHYTT